MTDGNAQPDALGGSVSVSDIGESQRRRGALRGDQLTLPRAMLDPLIVGVLAAAVSLGAAGRPSFWYDEAATISASYSRSLGQLWQMLRNVDAVHGLYYLLMHGWFQIFPPTEFWSRAPSGLAVGGAAAGLVVLGKQFSSRTAAVASGVVCAILPRTTWAGIEARPYAFSMMAAVWLTVVLVYAARRNNTAAWLSYGIVLAISTLLDVYLVLLFLAHVAFICAFQRRQKVIKKLDNLVLAYNRRVDLTLSSTGQESARVYPFNANDFARLVDQNAPRKAHGVEFAAEKEKIGN